ncbi:TrmH family RNA methyltransferase [Abyssalbus ytuae]|uniref:RNA methyltransferase n=1 Tax=Abyssalbus ytuae TaxID=2926907 RepID=A0A9E6ZS03_9FLAO|nr:RNA methyltransferase [Abyssalbus ytuae]UOB16783.1 RNA methyltransferase [Abyssalbus ytuae]
MVSKNQIKLIKSLHQKKYRNLNSLFIAEGIKVINELIREGMDLHTLYATSAGKFTKIDENKFFEISESELKKISFLKTPNHAVAIFKIPAAKKINNKSLVVALDDIRDPGNLGTIIRLCDWFGITDLVCSINTVDCYNPKVVQATMGSLARVNITYLELEEFIKESGSDVFIADMEGENVYKTNLPSNGILIMGNEANGISQSIRKAASKKLSIPRFGSLQKTESLNVATATAILLSEFKRRS